jgi:hypothetical protein
MKGGFSVKWAWRIGLSAIVIWASAGRLNAQDDWQAVGRHTEGGANPDANSAKPAPSPSWACGEQALPASDQIKSIVARIDDLWRTDVQVYRSVRPVSPHAMQGGCIFYNPVSVDVLLVGVMSIREQSAANAMLYAIMAHEVGHEMHHDFDPERANIPGQTKELEADRFAGYTLQRLDIALPDDITPYYSLVGDEFWSSKSHTHGYSGQRTAALKRGYELAEWGQAEDTKSPLEEGSDLAAPGDASQSSGP